MKTSNRRHLILLLAIFGVLNMFVQHAQAQVQSVTVEDVNPDRSTLDIFNPNGASGGRVNHVAISAQDGAMYAASEWGGLFKSTDQGNTWKQLAGHVPAATWDIVVDPGDARRIYATSFYDGKVASLAGINVSFDGGNSWFHPPTATPRSSLCLSPVRRDEPSAFGISIDPNNRNRVYIGTNCGLAISEDRGLTWRFVDPTPADGADDIWDVVVHDRGIIDLIGDDGHQRSINGGVSWTSAGFLPGGLGSIDVSPDEANVLFATTGTLIWESPDGGQTWTSLTNPRAQGRIPFVKTNEREGASFDLWFGDVTLNRTICTTPTGGGLGARCPVNSWIGTGTGAHADMGDVAFTPQTSTDEACPVLMSSDGGVYINTIATSPECHTPSWEQPTVTPHALWLWDLSGTSYQGALNDVIVGRRSSVNMRYEILDDANAGFSQIHSGGSGWGSGNYATSVATGDVDRDGLAEYIVGRHSNVNMRYEILDDAKAGFTLLHSGGSGWGSGNYTTSVATGDIDGDGLDEIVIGRRSDVNMRYEILDDAKAGFTLLHSGGLGWGSDNYTTSVATGDIDGDGLDEIVIGRRSDVNMRYEILDDAKAGFTLLHSGGSGWGSGNYTTSVATGDVDNDGLDEIVIGRRSNVNMRYEILDDAKAGFTLLQSGGSGWGSGNYTTSVATGDVDNDGLDEVVIGRHSNVNMRYEILDDAKAGFAQIHSGGSGWGSGNYTTSVATGDIDNDGLDEVVIGRRSNVNMRYEVLDDAKAGFAEIHNGGAGWGSGNYTTTVAVGPTGGKRLDLYFGNQDTGSFSSTNAEALKPTWLNVDCCDSFEVSPNQTQMLLTVCCFSPGRFNRLFLRQPGMIDGAEINTYPPGNLRGFSPTDDVAMFGPASAAVITTGGVFITTDINANPIAWTQVGSTSTPFGARHVTPVGQGAGTIFYVQAPNGDLGSPDTLWRYRGTAPGGVWQQVLPPGGVGNFAMYAVDPQNAERIMASHLRPGLPPAMIITTDGGTIWNSLPALDGQMTWGGAFVAQTRRGPTRFTGFGGYPQPFLAAFSPVDPNLIVAAGVDSGVFVTIDGGATWETISDPFNPAGSGIPHIPRAKFAHFDHLADGPEGSKVNIYVGTRGRGVFRIRLAYLPSTRRSIASCFRPGAPVCREPKMEAGRLILDCRDRSLPCLFVDPVPKNCLVKFQCPGCDGMGLCPPWYRVHLSGLDPDLWEVDLLSATGNKVSHKLYRTEIGALLEVRPNRSEFISGSIGNFSLGLRRKRDEGSRIYQVITRLERADRAFQPEIAKLKETPGMPDSTDDPIGIKRHELKPEAMAKADPLDDPINIKSHKLIPEFPGKPDPSDDPIGLRAYEPKPE